MGRERMKNKKSTPNGLTLEQQNELYTAYMLTQLSDLRFDPVLKKWAPVCERCGRTYGEHIPNEHNPAIGYCWNEQGKYIRKKARKQTFTIEWNKVKDMITIIMVEAALLKLSPEEINQMDKEIEEGG